MRRGSQGQRFEGESHREWCPQNPPRKDGIASSPDTASTALSDANRAAAAWPQGEAATGRLLSSSPQSLSCALGSFLCSQVSSITGKAVLKAQLP